MSFSLGGNKQKTNQTSNESMNQTSTFNPNQQFLDMTQTGLNQSLGLMGNYGQTTGADVANYLNPNLDYQYGQIARQGDISANNINAQAAAAGAMGGSGWGLMRRGNEENMLLAQQAAAGNAYGAAQQAAMGERANAAQYDMGALQTYLSGLGLLGNWGTTNTSGTSTGTTKGKTSGFNFGVSGSL